MNEFEKERQERMEEYLNGAKVSEMAIKRGVSREAIYQSLRRLEDWRGVKRGQRDIRKQPYMELAEKVYEEVMAVAEFKETLEKVEADKR